MAKQHGRQKKEGAGHPGDQEHMVEPYRVATAPTADLGAVEFVHDHAIVNEYPL